MTTLLPLLSFLADAAMVAAAAWLGLCAAGLGRRGLIESTLGWMLLALAWIVGSGVLLGLTGGLGRPGFFWLHAGALTVLGGWRWSRRRDDGRQWADWLAGWGRLLRGGTPVGWATLGLLVMLLMLAVLAAQAEPMVFDALTYRLSRIGLWLQDGRIAHFQTDDPRLNYMPVGPDLVIAWLLGATNEGFYLAPLSQLVGGGLLLGATFGLARVVGLGRLAAMGAVALVLGMANVAVQFTTIQSDLFTAGVFAASYLLWHRALLRGEGSWIGGIGLALAWGSKGTMFYLAPGAALWVGWLVWQHRQSWRALGPTAAGAVLALVVFVAPSYARNLTGYRSLFGPREAVVLHHGESLTSMQHVEKLRLNLLTSAVQLCDPVAQPFWCRDLLRATGRALLPLLPGEDDPYLFLHHAPRRILAEGILQQVEPDADMLSCGLLAAGLFVAGLLAAAVRSAGDAMAAQILVWSGGVVGYVLVQHALVQWHQWGFRFMVLAAPWLGVVGAWAVGRLARRFQAAAWAVLVVSALQIFFVVQWRANQAAWQAVTRPEPVLSHFIYANWRAWAGRLDQPEKPMRLALPINYALAAFCRTRPPRSLALEPLSGLHAATAEAAVTPGGGWLVVPAFRFKGREGLVMGQTWLFNGEENNLHSLAAYRALQPGESPAPMVYRFSQSFTADGMQRRLLVKTWQPQVSLRLRNPAAFPWRYEVRAGSEKKEGVVPAGEEILLQVAVGRAALSEVVVDFHAAQAARDQTEYPTATLARP